MQEWSDKGCVIAIRHYGEADCVATLLTEHHGLRSGLVKGARGRRLRGILQPGNIVDAYWFARLEDHLGRLRIEGHVEQVAKIMMDANRLIALNSLCATTYVGVPERIHIEDLYRLTASYLAVLCDPDLPWQAEYLLWELHTLAALGFGLDLSKCAVTGEPGPLAFVSPRTGHAVTRTGAGEYLDRLLLLPDFMSTKNKRSPTIRDINDGWTLVSHFWDTRVFAEKSAEAPQARGRLGNFFRRQSKSENSINCCIS